VEVFDRLRDQSLRLKPDKCEFLRKEIYFLGYKVTADGVAMDERKAGAINKYAVPTTTKQLREFLGLVGFYRKFVPRFSLIASPLHELTRKMYHMRVGESRQKRSRHRRTFCVINRCLNTQILKRDLS
jgi:hypothetical protein